MIQILWFVAGCAVGWGVRNVMARRQLEHLASVAIKGFEKIGETMREAKS